MPAARITRRRAAAAVLLFGLSSVTPRSRAEDAAPRPQSAPKAKPGSRPEGTGAAWLSLPPTPTLPATTRSGHVTVNGTSIFYAQFGEGPPVLLLHGGLANSNYWGHQVGELAQKFTVIVMDTRGHGRSPVMSRAFSYRIFAEDAVALLDALKIPSAAVVGWSDGAITGLQLAMTRPDRISKLFAFGANSTVDGLNPSGSKSRVFAQFSERCRTEYSKLSPHPERWSQLLDGLRPMWRSEPRYTAQQLASVKVPTAISDGEHDEIIKREHTVLMSREIPGAQLVILPQVSHFAMLQNPGRFNRALTEFLTTPGG
jgi:pimeloyl-ACP methyl ester carboxylesterase